jgi:hypothetical protein
MWIKINTYTSKPGPTVRTTLFFILCGRHMRTPPHPTIDSTHLYLPNHIGPISDLVFSRRSNLSKPLFPNTEDGTPLPFAHSSFGPPSTRMYALHMGLLHSLPQWSTHGACMMEYPAILHAMQGEWWVNVFQRPFFKLPQPQSKKKKQRKVPRPLSCGLLATTCVMLYHGPLSSLMGSDHAPSALLRMVS